MSIYVFVCVYTVHNISSIILNYLYLMYMCIYVCIGVCQKRLAGLKSDQEKLIKKVYIVRCMCSSLY